MAIAIRGERDSGRTINADWITQAEWAVELHGVMVPAEVQLRPWL